MTSQTTEHYGLLSIIILLHCICAAENISKTDNANIEVYIDNKEVGYRGNNLFEPQNVSEYLEPDADLWALTSQLLLQLPIDVKIQWIKSHQDEDENGIRIYGPHKLPTQMNIDSDHLASKGVSKDKKLIQPTYSTTAITFRSKEGHQVDNFHKYLTKQANGKELLKYYEEKRGWGKIIITKIDWEGLDSTLKTYGPIKFNHVIQLMHNWQNVGAQQAQFNKASGEDTIQPREEEVLCPMGCNAIEIPLHYLWCQEDTIRNERYKHKKEGLNVLRTMQTEDIIISIFAMAMEKIGNLDDINMDASLFKGQILKIIGQAYDDQEEIGWRALFQGYIAKRWSIAQDQSYKSKGVQSRSLNGNIWSKKTVTMLQTYSYKCWQTRNNIKHGNNKEENKKEERKRLKTKIRELYRYKKKLKNKQGQKHFYTPINKRLKQGNYSMKVWLSTAEEIIRLDRERATKNTIVHWIQHRPG